MLFTSFEFIIFFWLTFALYWSLNRRGQNFFLMVASLFFYGWWDWRYLSLLLVSVALDFVCGKRIPGASNPKKWLWISVVGNLLILGVFKYANFFIVSANEALTSLGLATDIRTLRVLLPLGISFYTFQSMAYTVDVYKGKTKPETSWVDFTLFVTFFPQLIAGPIERASHILGQLKKDRTVTHHDLANGLVLMGYGFFKKLVIADNLAILVDSAYGDITRASSFDLILATILFGFQIYCDFHGYSLIAKGIARLFGIELRWNFDFPYLATSIQDFWRRWHISLSEWLRDYLYISLGGNRLGPVRTYTNLLMTMLLGGLWHGAAWNFVLWGTLHGGALALHRLWVGTVARPGSALVGWFLTMVVVFISWALFRIDKVRNLEFFYKNQGLESKLLAFGPQLNFGLTMMVLLFVFEIYLEKRPQLQGWLDSKSVLLRYGMASALLLIALATPAYEKNPFIYFQF